MVHGTPLRVPSAIAPVPTSCHHTHDRMHTYACLLQPCFARARARVALGNTKPLLFSFLSQIRVALFDDYPHSPFDCFPFAARLLSVLFGPILPVVSSFVFWFLFSFCMATLCGTAPALHTNHVPDTCISKTYIHRVLVLGCMRFIIRVRPAVLLLLVSSSRLQMKKANACVWLGRKSFARHVWDFILSTEKREGRKQVCKVGAGVQYCDCMQHQRCRREIGGKENK